VKRVEYLMEIFKLLVNFVFLLLTGIAFLGYNLFFVDKDKILVLLIFIGVGIFWIGVLAFIIKNLNNKIVENLKE